MNHPDFLIVGGAKCGTSSVWAYCSQHPEIFMSPMKEARFLGYGGAIPGYQGYGELGERKMQDYDHTLPTSWEQYQALFDGAKIHQKIGEASPAYLYLEEAPGKICSYLPDAKLIVILRHPAERAFSSYLHLLRDNSEDLSFVEALAAEPRRIQENAGLPWRYLDLGFYGRQLQRYREIFPPDQLLVLLHEDLLVDQEGSMSKIFQFIGVDPDFKPNIGTRHNVSGIPRNRTLYEGLVLLSLRMGRLIPSRIRKRLKRRIQSVLLRKPALDVTLRRELNDLYRSDILLLEKLLNRNLSDWLA